jgi:hypothetical protein
MPRLIWALTDRSANVRRHAASALGKLAVVEAVQPLLELLEGEDYPQVRQYAITALGRLGDKRAAALLEHIADDAREKQYNQKAARQALQRLGVVPAPRLPRMSARLPRADPVGAFLAASHARPLAGPWSFGWALDFHSRFEGDRNRRGQVGDLVFRYKYCGEVGLANELATRWHQLLAECCDGFTSTAVVPVPSSVEREPDLVWLLASSLAERLGLPAWRDALVKAHATRPQKYMTSLAQKRANLAGAFAVQCDVRGQRLLLVDDVHDSGETLAEATRVLLRAGAAAVMVLTLTTTIHTSH